MSAPPFRTDVTIRGPGSQTLHDRPTNARGLLSKEYLDNAAESVNKQIDNDIKALLDAFEALVGLSRIRDKDKFRIAQETFELEARADVMVRAAQSLTLLSHSLKLSLLLSQEPIESAATQDGIESQTLDEEAIELIKSTAREKERCARILEQMFGIDRKEENGKAEDIQNAGHSTQEAFKPEAFTQEFVSQAEASGAGLDEEEEQEQEQDLEMEPVE